MAASDLMTLILAVITGHYAIHASDRYTSIQPTPKHPSPDWDLHANKTVVALGTDCWLAIGYSGLAYLDNRPTDRLIAEAISGYDELSDKAAFTGWFPTQPPHYREIRDRIEKRIAEAYSRLPRAVANKYATSVLAAGVQRKDNSIYGVMFKVVIQGNATSATEIGEDRLRWNKFQTGCIGSLAHNQHILSDAKKKIAGPGVSKPEDIRDILIDAVIESSKVDPGIGSDVMAVIVDKYGDTIDTYFKTADAQRQAELAAQVESSKEFRDKVSVATPYVLTPGMIFGPSVSPKGGWVTDRGLKFNFSGFDSDDGPGTGGVYFGGQPRKPPPK